MEAPAVSSAENVRRTGLCAGSDFTISYRSCVFFLHFSKCSINIKDTWRGIEVVITGLTRNQFASNRTWVRIPSSPPKTQSYQGFCPYDWAFLFSQGHISVHDFRQELRCASRSAPAASPAPPAGNRPQCTAASWGAPPCRRGEGTQIHFDGVFQCLVDYFFSRHPNLGKLGLTKGRIYAIHE